MGASTSFARVKRLRLHDFRSYHQLDWPISAPLIALWGENGAGKTNILEALSLLSPGRGMRRAALSSFANRKGGGGFTILADVKIEGDAGEAILFATAMELGESKREARINREPVASANHFLDYFSFLWLTPDQDGLFRGAAGDRRRFLDRLVLALDKQHGSRAHAFEQALRHRNRLLEAYNGGTSRWLDAIEHEIVDLGVALAAARSETVLRLNRLVQTPFLEGDGSFLSSPFPEADLQLEGALEQQLACEPAGVVEDWYRENLRQSRLRDRAAGRALVGPQVSDLVVIHKQKGEPAATCSTGEQKALLIGLILAQARLITQMRGAPPFLLLDEVAAHLDGVRRAGLFQLLHALGGQVFMTGTDQRLFEALGGDYECFKVEVGEVKLSHTSS